MALVSEFLGQLTLSYGGVSYPSCICPWHTSEVLHYFHVIPIFSAQKHQTDMFSSAQDSLSSHKNEEIIKVVTSRFMTGSIGSFSTQTVRRR